MVKRLRSFDGYSFDDVLLEPGLSLMDSRSQVDLKTQVGPKLNLSIPIVSSPMDTVTGVSMSSFMSQKGGLGFLHRYEPEADTEEKIWSLTQAGNETGVAVSSKTVMSWIHGYLAMGVRAIVLDIAHQDTLPSLKALETIASGVEKHGDGPKVSVISGNLATAEAATRAISAGADILRVGIGAGSACTTREVAGIGVPQLTAVNDVALEAAKYDVGIIADGGIRKSGDIVKALAVGAHAVMLGGLLASYSISEKPGKFRGMASKSARYEYLGNKELGYEGAEFENVTTINDYEDHFDHLVEGVRLGLAYTGSSSIQKLQENAKWITISANSTYEQGAHFGHGH